jgi:hypothetical protein
MVMVIAETLRTEDIEACAIKWARLGRTGPTDWPLSPRPDLCASSDHGYSYYRRNVSGDQEVMFNLEHLLC